MLCKQRIILNRVAQSTDLLSQIVRAIIHEVEGLSNLPILFIVVSKLDGARVHIAVYPLPLAHF